MLPTPMDGSNPFQIGRGLAQIGVGIAEMRTGAAGEVAGVALDATGAGTVEGLALNVAAGAVIVQGAGTAAVLPHMLGHMRSNTYCSGGLCRVGCRSPLRRIGDSRP